MNALQYHVDQRVSWKAGGKVSRLEGVAGQVVWGTVVAVHADRSTLGVTPDHRLPKLATFHGLDASVEFSQIIQVAP